VKTRTKQPLILIWTLIKMPGLNKSLVTLFIETFLAYCPSLRNTHCTSEMFEEWASYHEQGNVIQFYLAELEWDDFEVVSNAFVQFFVDDIKLFIMDVTIHRFDQIVKVFLSIDAYSILQSANVLNGFIV